MVARETNQVIRGLKLSATPVDLQGEGKDWRLNQLSMANDLINPLIKLP